MVAHGTIAFDTLTTSDQVKTGIEKSIDTSYLLNGVAKAWVDASGDGATLTNSFNYSGGVDNAEGDYTYSFTNSMDNINYSVLTGAHYAVLQGTYSQATGSVRIKCFTRADSITADDAVNFNAIHGELA